MFYLICTYTEDKSLHFIFFIVLDKGIQPKYWFVLVVLHYHVFFLLQEPFHSFPSLFHIFFFLVNLYYNLHLIFFLCLILSARSGNPIVQCTRSWESQLFHIVHGIWPGPSYEGDLSLTVHDRVSAEMFTVTFWDTGDFHLVLILFYLTVLYSQMECHQLLSPRQGAQMVLSEV